MDGWSGWPDVPWTSTIRNGRALLTECAARIGRPASGAPAAEPRSQHADGIRDRRPCILIPSVADTWSDDRRRAVLLHELAHIARHDCVTQLLAAVACAIYWIHPGVWWVARRLRIERELACDDRVLSAGTHAREYAAHLLELAYALGGYRAPALVVSMARPRQVEGRMIAVLDAARNRAVPAWRGQLAGAVIAAALLVPIAAAAGHGEAGECAGDQTGKPAAQGAHEVPTRRPSPGRACAGTWEIRATQTAPVVYLRLSESASSSHGSTIAIERLEGLAPALLSGAGGAAKFGIRRDAGVLTFDGTFHSGVGAGTYTFTPSASFPAELVKRGFARPTPADQYHSLEAISVRVPRRADHAAVRATGPAIAHPRGASRCGSDVRTGDGRAGISPGEHRRVDRPARSRGLSAIHPRARCAGTAVASPPTISFVPAITASALSTSGSLRRLDYQPDARRA